MVVGLAARNCSCILVGRLGLGRKRRLAVGRAFSQLGDSRSCRFANNGDIRQCGRTAARHKCRRCFGRRGAGAERVNVRAGRTGADSGRQARIHRKAFRSEGRTSAPESGQPRPVDRRKAANSRGDQRERDCKANCSREHCGRAGDGEESAPAVSSSSLLGAEPARCGPARKRRRVRSNQSTDCSGEVKHTVRRSRAASLHELSRSSPPHRDPTLAAMKPVQGWGTRRIKG